MSILAVDRMPTLSDLTMNILATLRERFRPVLAPLTDSVDDLLEMIRPAQDARFGDYQANFAMPLGKQLGQAAAEIAEQIVTGRTAGRSVRAARGGRAWVHQSSAQKRLGWSSSLSQVAQDDRLAIAPVSEPRTFVIDYSSPNVAKAMHVGHIRSTVIGDALYRTLQFMGHQAISDNHLGDWGTQFGMIIYGYKHFVDEAAYAEHPVQELGRLYKLVHQLVEYRECHCAAAGPRHAYWATSERSWKLRKRNSEPIRKTKGSRSWLET